MSEPLREPDSPHTLHERLRQLEDGMYRLPEQTRGKLRGLLEEARACQDVWAQGFAMCLLSGCAFYLGNPRETIELSAGALEFAREAQDLQLETRLLGGLALAHHRLGEYDRAFEYFLNSLRLAQQNNDEPGRFRALNNLASLYTDTGNTQQALAAQQDALAIAQHLPPPFRGSAMTHLIAIHSQLGDHEQVLRLAEESLPLIREHCPPRWLGTITRDVCRALLALGRPRQSLEAARQSLEEAQSQRDQENICALTLAEAAALMALGEWPAARSPLLAALERSREMGSRPLEVEALKLLAELHEGLGNHREALGYAREHFGLERQIHAREVESRSQLLTAEIRLELLHREAEIERLRNVELAQANSALQETQQVLLHRATHDPLTGVANRAHFQHTAQQALAGLQPGEHVALIFIDLDRFKEINDTLGHHAGDQLLQEVARRLSTAVRATDLVGRVGGDEFTVLLRRVAALEDVTTVAEKLRAALDLPFDLGSGLAQITASVGCAVAPTDGATAEALQQHADVAMYRVKHAGGNQVLHFDARMGEPARQRQLDRDLHAAQERGQLRLHYQGRYSLQGALVGFEALIRWAHPERGLLGPGTFIPLAERTRLILPMGAWVLREACSQAVQWDFAGRHLCMSVNVSPLQFEQLSFVDEVRAALNLTGLRPEALVLELTESLVMRDLDRARSHIEALQELGVQVAMDDFGTGYSSLSVLQALPFDHLKIDRSFTQGLATGPEHHTGSQRVSRLMGAMIGLAHTLQMQVTVEGVEHAAQLDLLRQLGCDHVQGYLLTRPLPPQEARQQLPPLPPGVSAPADFPDPS
ncbi:EAL domain-containing protein [Deinococcus navajonensis]|uniref:EAL domain-containing protein n=1 Tax=Deinococcus navajonensis TaxID=309884 RepID=A0ABV8XNX1_9DEIO